MNDKEEAFFLFLLLMILKGFNEIRKIEGEELNGLWKEWASRFKKIFQNKL
jgi:hypothetical protein